MTNTLPIVGITIGDSLGIGPEITAKAVLDARVMERCRPLIIGDRRLMEKMFELIGRPGFPVRWFGRDEEFVCEPGTVSGIDLANNSLHPSEETAGKAAVEYTYYGMRLALDGKIDALATGPVNKSNMNKAGYKFPGIAEVLADAVKREYVTLLIDPVYKISLVTAHVALKDLHKHITKERVLFTIQKTWEYLKRIGLEKPKIAVGSANPHCGDNGLIGDEEIVAISPAVEEARRQGIDATGPIQTPNIFMQARDGKYDAVVSMFHEQAVSVIGNNDFTTMTLNLPFVRTSVGHGTANDIAGKGIASPKSMILSILSAAEASARGIRTG
ncbi:MAG: hypothetical protein BAA02_05445 [Paenibacillaceae bacterium ZCTH02-B3]|nr:MAG: hypothetical protein BAA02_05445 [Paenibacillaceae bacterium ZCTH02-B3]